MPTDKQFVDGKNDCQCLRTLTKKQSYFIGTSNHSAATIPGCFPDNVAKAALVSLVRTLTIECDF